MTRSIFWGHCRGLPLFRGGEIFTFLSLLWWQGVRFMPQACKTVGSGLLCISRNYDCIIGCLQTGKKTIVYFCVKDSLALINYVTKLEAKLKTVLMPCWNAQLNCSALNWTDHTLSQMCEVKTVFSHSSVIEIANKENIQILASWAGNWPAPRNKCERARVKL